MRLAKDTEEERVMDAVRLGVSYHFFWIAVPDQVDYLTKTSCRT
jgi:hypothetical protein